VAVTYNGVEHGLLAVNAAGGRGADVLTTNLCLGKGSNGTVLALETGGPGNDSLTRNVPVQSGDKPRALAHARPRPRHRRLRRHPERHSAQLREDAVSR
jgi:hypothetical protein